MAAAGTQIAEQQPSSRESVERLNFNVTSSVAAEIRQLAGELGLTMSQLFRYAIGVLAIAVAESRRKRKLVIADEDGNAVRELVLPGLGQR